MEKTTNKNWWQVLATLYELLAFSFAYPTKDLAEVLASGEWEEAAQELVTILNLAPAEETPFSELSEYKGLGAEQALHRLRVEHTRLFIGAPTSLISPYEGVWRAADEGVDALLFVNPHSTEVERTMNSLGVGRPEGTNEPLDHISTEFELLQYLAMIEAGLTEPTSGVEAPEEGWSSAHDTFLKEHVLAWVPRFADKVIVETKEPFFKTASALLKATLE